jgi:thioredoxin 2
MSETLNVVCAHCDRINRVPRARLKDAGKCGACHQPLFGGGPIELDDPQRFARHTEKSDIPFLVDFWAPWCGPCRTMAPVFEQAAEMLEPEVRLAKVNIDAAPDTAMRYALRSIPAVLLLRHGREIAKTLGAMPLPQLVAWTRQHVDGVAA